MSGIRQATFGYLRHIQPHLKVCPVIALSILLEMAFYAGLPFSFRYIVDYGLLRDDHSLLYRLIAGLVAAAVAVSLLGYVRDRVYARLTASMLTDFRVAIFDHVQQLSLDFFSAGKSGEILASFSTDLASLETACKNFLGWGVLPALDILAGTALMFFLDWKLALMALLVWPITLAGPRIFSPRVAAESYQRRVEDTRVLSLVKENLEAQVLIKAFDLTNFFRTAFLERAGALRERMFGVGRYSGMLERSAYTGIVLLQVSILAAGAYMVSRGLLTVGALAAFQAIFLTSSYSLATLTQYVPTLVEAQGGMRRIGDLLEVETAMSDSGTAQLPKTLPEIRFEDVAFSYSADQAGLCDLNFSIHETGMVAIVGSSGSGKSTVLSLLMRLYDPDRGRITVNGADLKSVAIRELRSRIGYVPQESFLLDLSVRDNIRLGCPSATDAEVEEAAKAAEIHDFIARLPYGYDTEVGERGGRLSGGQRQRIALARAIVRDPSLLILDESTSALDAAAESAILKTLDRLRKGRTVILVTHRLSSVVRADRILVMDRGRLAGDGTHAELVRRPGPYQRLWQKQHGFVMDEARHRFEVSVERLRQVPVFYGLADDVIESAVHLFRGEEHPQGRVIVREGEFGAYLYIIVRGRVELLRDIESGKQQRSGVLEEGDCFGESALLEEVPEGETVRTIEPCVLLTLNRANFRQLTERRPAYANG
ncbi:MAG: ATP-binding cassette domain-containing protein [Bryobacterales bacterium]|nr:ATP-binding cassette domain-containing protein [Bryobacterales bacterium]MBV9396613.1 ATP-binding cassette domain-containing protein [Bryobacterales bacterium]